MSKLKRLVEELKNTNGTELEAPDKGVVHFGDIPGICKFYHSSPVLLPTIATRK